MRNMKLDKKSIVYRVTTLVIVLIVAQTVLLSVFLILGGVLSQARNNAYASFAEKVKNRKDYLQREMSTRWTNMGPYLEQISAMLTDHTDSEQFFDEASEDIISIMRSTQATGAFVILNQEEAGLEYPSLYFRDYDPILNDYGNKDLYMIFGPADIANRLKIPLDQMWSHKLPLSEMHDNFYKEPFQKASLSDNTKLLGYWSLPFKLFPEDLSIITYTQPLLSKNKEVVGVIGIEISTKYFSQFLPPNELQARDSLGYFIAYKKDNREGIEPIILTRVIQNQILKPGEELTYSQVAKSENIFLLDEQKGRNDIYLCIEEMNLYSDNTPFQEEQWYIVGLMNGKNLLSYVNKIQNIILFSLLSSILIGVIGGYLISYRFTRPIILLARKVKSSDIRNKVHLEKTGLTEVDQLSSAIQSANDSLLESAIKMSQIINLAGLKIGAFEYRKDSNYVFATDQLMSILEIEPDIMELLKADKKLFKNRINELLSIPENDEENVYILPSSPSRWIKIKEVSTDRFTIGVITDVTNEIHEKKNMIRERDYDYLTQIYNRKAIHRKGDELLATRKRNKESAVLMFDLDNLKVVNDSYGHEWGDKYIKLAVKYLNSISDERIMLGRRSGDEFVLMFYDFNTRDEIRNCVQTFYHRLNNDPLRLPDEADTIVKISSGLVWVNEYDITFNEYLIYADEALYYAKKNNKGTCCEYDNYHRS